MIQYEQLKETIDQVRGTTFAGMTTLTQVKLKGGKKNPHQGRVTKRTEGSNVILFANTKDPGYVSLVRKRMISEGKDPDTFEPQPRRWGVRVENTPFISHNDKYYLECFFVSAGKSTYFLDGEEIEKDKIEGLEDKEEKESRESFKESQGAIENKVIIRTFDLNSIESIKLRGTEL